MKSRKLTDFIYVEEAQVRPVASFVPGAILASTILGGLLLVTEVAHATCQDQHGGPLHCDHKCLDNHIHSCGGGSYHADNCDITGAACEAHLRGERPPSLLPENELCEMAPQPS